jgi:hypothetical protein
MREEKMEPTPGVRIEFDVETGEIVKAYIFATNEVEEVAIIESLECIVKPKFWALLKRLIGREINANITAKMVNIRSRFGHRAISMKKSTSHIGTSLPKNGGAK